VITTIIRTAWATDRDTGTCVFCAVANPMRFEKIWGLSWTQTQRQILSRHSVLSTVPRKRAGRWGVRLRKGQGIPVFSKCPPNLLFSRYQGLLPRGKATGLYAVQWLPSCGWVLRNTGAIPLHPLYAFVALTGKTYPYIYLYHVGHDHKKHSTHLPYVPNCERPLNVHCAGIMAIKLITRCKK